MKFLYKNSALVSDDQIRECAEKLQPYIAHVKKIAEKNEYTDPECSINCPFDDAVIEKVNMLVREKASASLKYILLIGIGGSNLGTKAVYDAVQGFFDVCEPQVFPKMIFVDTTNAAMLARMKKIYNEVSAPEELLVISISKSGGTSETTANTEIVTAGLLEKFPHILHRLVVITDENSALWKATVEKNISVLPLQGLVGGRYSVLSAVGLFPLAMLGFNIDGIIAKARQMRDMCLSELTEENPALLSASILFTQLKQGKTIHDTFVFHSELESVGKWYRQLMGESIGKEQNNEGKTVNTGITPTVSVGSTDLHSVGQLYLGGPKDKITTFLYAAESTYVVQMPEKRLYGELVQAISGKSAQDILDAILGGTKIAYKKKQLPFVEAVLDRITPEEIVAFFQFKMIEMMYLARLMGVNAFDQPNVENYKVETKGILEARI